MTALKFNLVPKMFRVVKFASYQGSKSKVFLKKRPRRRKGRWKGRRKGRWEARRKGRWEVKRKGEMEEEEKGRERRGGRGGGARGGRGWGIEEEEEGIERLKAAEIKRRRRK